MIANSLQFMPFLSHQNFQQLLPGNRKWSLDYVIEVFQRLVLFLLRLGCDSLLTEIHLGRSRTCSCDKNDKWLAFFRHLLLQLSNVWNFIKRPWSTGIPFGLLLMSEKKTLNRNYNQKLTLYYPFMLYEWRFYS